MQGTFLLGLGTPKAGTSWIWDYLNESPGTAFQDVKEWNVWDALTVEELAHFNRLRWRNLSLWQAVLQRRPVIRRKRFLNDPQLYFDYFARVLKDPDVHLTGDLTPGHVALPTTALRTIRDGFAARQVETKAVFTMRDPVERCWSHLRMLVDDGLVEKRFEPIHDMAAQFPDFCRSKGAMLRTDYPSTVARLREVFPEDRIHFCLYESMFRPDEVERLSAFCGVPPRHERADIVVNPGKSRSLPDEARAAARDALQPIYEATEALFPQTRQLWSLQN